MRERQLEATRRDIVQLSVLALLLMVACAGALLTYTWSELNRAEAEQETLLVQRKVDRNLMRLRQEATSATAWDAAYLKTAGPMDRDWIDQKLASYYSLSFEHDVTLLFDADSTLQYAARDGERAPLKSEAELAAAVAQSVRRVQTRELRRRGHGTPIGRYEARDIAQRSIVVAADGRAYLVAVAAILPADGLIDHRRPATVVVTGWVLNQRLLTQIEQDVGVENLRFTPGLPGPAHPGAVPLFDPNSRPLGVLTWTLARPGAEAVREMAKPALLGALLLALVFALLGLRIRRLLQDLREQDQVLEDSLAALTLARDEAQAASVAKSEFVANISHEIRTPLNGVLGMAQVLERGELTPVQRDRVQVIMQSGQALLSVVNDVLDMSKIEAGKLDIVEAPFDLDQLIEAVGQTYGAIANAKDVELTWGAGDAAGPWRGDADRIRQILLNVVSNAVKFTPAGRVRLEAEATDTGLVLAVHDEGIGIPAAKMTALFGAFSQVDSSRTRRFGGTGLGLAISRRLARLMGGDLTVDSREGQGSVFRLALPLQRLARTAPSPGDAQALSPTRGLRILAAEDNATNRMVLQAMLAPFGVDLILACDGAEAVELYRRQPFDLILMDVQMPVMDGIVATQSIRALEQAEGRAPTPILAVTADAMRHQAETYCAAGMNGLLAKPIEATALAQALRIVLDADEEGTGEPGHRKTA